MTDKGSTFAVLAVASLVLLLIVFGASRGNQDELDRSILGTQGLSAWLDHHEFEIARSHRRQEVSEEDVVLRVLALYDVDLLTSANIFTSTEDQQSQAKRCFCFQNGELACSILNF